MSQHLQRQIDKLRQMVLALGAMVERKVLDAIAAIGRRDVPSAQAVIDSDNDVDLFEVELEEECLHTLALHQPVAVDLRYVVAVLKINNDLERIGDLAVNIAEQAVFLAEEAPLADAPEELQAMTEKVTTMLRRSLDALVRSDADLAQTVRESDDAVDALHRRMYDRVTTGIREHPHQLEQHIHLLSVSRNLERIADHSVNIAEDVLYMARGDIIRHHRPHPLLPRTEPSH